MTTATTRTARKAFRCEDCRQEVEPGQEYARLVAFPSDDFHSGTRPWVLRLCRSCQTRYGREMPPRRTRSAA